MARTGRGVTVWSFLADAVTPLMVSAIRVLGLEVLAAGDEGMALPDQGAVAASSWGWSSTPGMAARRFQQC